jgi:predicted amidohydrolase
VKVAAYQAPLLSSGSFESLSLIRRQIKRCEAECVEILCCPEAIIGGLADYADDPSESAIHVSSGQLNDVLKPLASDTVTSIIGFTERGDDGQLFNAAAVFHKGSVLGVYRKLHPAIRRSVYAAGDEAPVFRLGDFTFGIVICRDTTYLEPARSMVASGATALFVPANNSLPKDSECADLPAEARNADIALAVDNRVYVVRADVAGRNESLLSYGSSEIVDPNGMVLQSAKTLNDDLIIDEIETVPYIRDTTEAI